MEISKWILTALLLLNLQMVQAAESFSEEQRLEGFAEHKRKNAQFEKERLSDVDGVKKSRKVWEEQLQKAVADYKASKNRQSVALDESSPEYKEDLKAKKQRAEELEKFRQEYVRERNLKKAQKNSHIHLTEEEELGLIEKDQRVDIAKRSLYGGGGSSAHSFNSGRGGRNTRGGTTDFAPPPSDFSPPPPPPASPEFYEPEIPPPPPPPPMEFEEPIPPPVFDDGADF